MILYVSNDLMWLTAVEALFAGLWAEAAIGKKAGLAAAAKGQPLVLVLDRGMGRVQEWRRAAPSAVIVSDEEGSDAGLGGLDELLGVALEAQRAGAEQERRVRRGRSTADAGGRRRHLN